jgi:hypothetical protein
MKVTKVETAQSGGGEFVTENGTLYPSEYTFADGESGVMWHKTQEPKFKAGDEVAYQIKGKGKNGVNKVKIESAQYANKGGGNNYTPQPKNSETQDQIMRQSCLKASVEALGHHKEPLQYITLAQYFFNYCKTGEVKGGKDEL